MTGLSKAEVRANEYRFFEAVQELFGCIDSRVEEKEFGVIQGAMTSIFNGVAPVATDSKYLTQDRRRLLEKWNDRVFKLRDELVTAVEIEHQEFEKAATAIDFSNRSQNIQTTLKDYIREWYEQ